MQHKYLPHFVSRMKKSVWKDVPNPNKCSWAKGLDFKKVKKYALLKSWFRVNILENSNLKSRNLKINSVFSTFSFVVYCISLGWHLWPPVPNCRRPASLATAAALWKHLQSCHSGKSWPLSSDYSLDPNPTSVPESWPSHWLSHVLFSRVWFKGRTNSFHGEWGAPRWSSCLSP